MWLRWEHRKVCETRHWRLSCRMTGTRVLYVSILCARANGRWKISRMSMHWVCVSRFILPSRICPPLYTEINHHTSWRALSFISVIRDIFAKYLTLSFLPSPSTSSKWPLFTGPSSKILRFIISPHASYICGSILHELCVQYVRTSLPEIQSNVRIVMNAVQILRNSCFYIW